jgi:hypothetical protein
MFTTLRWFGRVLYVQPMMLGGLAPLRKQQVGGIKTDDKRMGNK